jgi:indole-3-glycerol phosphate synthase
VSERLAPRAPDGALLIAESGIGGADDCRRLAKAGIRCFLVGESLMRAADIAAATRTLVDG